MKRKHPFTLLEIMIVIFIIGLISSIVGYSMKGSLDKGRKFKTEQAIERIRDIIELEIAKDFDKRYSAEDYLRRSGLVKNPLKMLKDGWNQPFNIKIGKDGNVTVTSQALINYYTKHGI